MQERETTTMTTYTIRRADEREGLLGLARRFLGDASRWPELYEANRSTIGHNPTALRAGQALHIGSACWDEIAEGKRSYEVQPADVVDGLRGIARKLYADDTRWHELYVMNLGVIGDEPEHLQPGQ